MNLLRKKKYLGILAGISYLLNIIWTPQIVTDRAKAMENTDFIRNPYNAYQTVAGGIHSAGTSPKYKVWDCIELGMYPQSAYTPDTLPDSPEPGSTYTDLDGTRYEYAGKNQCFKYEPVRWRILSVNGTDAYVVADMVLDCQPYEKRGAVREEEKSYLCQWLNDGFRKKAFTQEQWEAVQSDSQDIGLLSYLDCVNENYGFEVPAMLQSQTRIAAATDYAICRGAENLPTNSDRNENSSWWLSSAPTTAEINSIVTAYGEVSDTDFELFSGRGVRPAMHINLDSSAVTYGGKVKIQTNFLATWDTVFLGAYPQNKYTPNEIPESPEQGKTYTDSDGTQFVYAANRNKKAYYRWEPIRWRVLSINREEAVLLADVNLDSQVYHTKQEAVTWKESRMRHWLNTNFMESAFSDRERQKIIPSYVLAEENPVYGTPGGEDTEDNFYLMSFSDIMNVDYGFENVMHGQNKKQSVSTGYANMQSDSSMTTTTVYEADFCDRWWLRSPGREAGYAGVVTETGTSDAVGAAVNAKRYGVRPMLRVRSENLLSLYAGIRYEDGFLDETNAIVPEIGKRELVNDLADVPTATVDSEPTATADSQSTSEPTATADSQPTSEPTATVDSQPTSEPTATAVSQSTSEPTATVDSQPTSEPTATAVSQSTSEPTATAISELTSEPKPSPAATNGSISSLQQPKPDEKQEAKKKLLKRPVFTLKKARTAKGLRCVCLRLKKYEGTHIEIYIRNRKKKYAGIRLSKSKASIKRNRKVFRMIYSKKGVWLYCKVRTYRVVKGKRRYSEFSKVRKIRL